MISTTTLTGIAASTFTAISLLPQLIKILRSKEAGDISFGMLGILLAGLGLWVYYGLLIEDYIIVVSNSFSFIINSCIIILSIKYKPAKARERT